MIIYIGGHEFRYEMEALIRMFLRGTRLTVELGPPQESGDYVHTCIRNKDGQAMLIAAAKQGDRVVRRETESSVGQPPDEYERLLAVTLYAALSELTGTKLQWGILTGIRPVKLVHRWHAQGLDDGSIADLLARRYLVSPGKAALALETARHEAPVLARSRPESYSLYLAIPFCPSRCSYCSFVSHSIEKTHKLVPEYVELLLREIEYAAGVMKSIGGLRLETIYIGGGTPTTLTAEQLRRVMDAAGRCFGPPLSGEYTVEAGRPDTITPEKLQVMKEYGATRISINPQSMNDAVLQAVGRGHTARQTEEAFQAARKAGHHCINMDLIAGLPGDTPAGFGASLDRVLALDPENVTVHTLTVKRAADLAGGGADRSAPVERMLDYASHQLAQAGQRPYYLYRQKNTIGNLENVGYCKEGHEGLYNVFIMDETHTIVALGAGGVTKLRRPGGEELERIFNYKYPYEYISRFDEVLARKDRMADFYRKW